MLFINFSTDLYSVPLFCPYMFYAMIEKPKSPTSFYVSVIHNIDSFLGTYHTTCWDRQHQGEGGSLIHSVVDVYAWRKYGTAIAFNVPSAFGASHYLLCHRRISVSTLIELLRLLNGSPMFHYRSWLCSGSLLLMFLSTRSLCFCSVKRETDYFYSTH